MEKSRRFLNNISLKRKLIAIYLMVSIVPIMSLGFYLTNQLYSTTLRHDIALTRSSHNQLQDNFLGVFDTYAGVLNGLIADARVMRYVETFYDEDYQAILDFRSTINPILRRIQLDNHNTFIRIYSANRSIAHSEELSNSLEDLAEEPWYRPAAGRTSSTLNWTATRRINDGNPSDYIGCFRELRGMTDGSVNRVFAVFFEESELHSMIAQEQESGKIIFLLDNDGTILATTERERVFSGQETLADAFGQDVSELESDTYSDYEDRNYSVIRSTFSREDLGIRGWSLLSLIPSESVTASVRQIWFTSIALSLICLSFSLVLVLWVSKNIADRAGRLIHQMNQVVASNYTISVVPTGADEIGTIERQFSSLVSRTGELIHEVLLANLKIKEAELDYQKLLTEKGEAEIIALQEQINPHYLFNTLETIRMNLIIAGDRKNAEMIGLFAESFRVAIERDREFYRLEEELEFVGLYFRIQEYRFRGNIRMEKHIPESLLSMHLPKLLIQPLVENAVYHGIEMKGEAGTVIIEAFREGQDLCIRVTDDGIGIPEQELVRLRETLLQPKSPIGERAHNRIALRNIHQRLVLMYGSAYGLSIESTAGEGTQVQIRIPIGVEASNQSGQ